MAHIHSKTTPEAIERRMRDWKVVELRRAGLDWHLIAEQLGLCDGGHAYRRFYAVMKDHPRENIEEARKIELDRLDALQAAIWQQCITEGKNQHWAMDRMLKISDQRARLLGLNAPVRQEISVLSESTVDKAIRELKEQMEQQAREAGVSLPTEAA